jgi:hypothetical protein
VNLRLFRFDDPEHREGAELLPWLINGTLEGLERERVERHVGQCVACRRELEAARALQAAVASDERDPAVAHSLARLRVRLEEEESGRGARWFGRMLARTWREARPAARSALAVQLALILALGSALTIVSVAEHPAPTLYHTLGDAPPAASARSAIAVVFRGERSEHEIRRLLLRLEARVTDGPSAAGVYRVEVPDSHQQAALALLRADPAVVFAEPMAAVGARPQ